MSITADPVTKPHFPARAATHLKWRAGQTRRRLLTLMAAWRLNGGRKSVTAMMRVRNEEEFLRPSVLSIAGLVDEVVIIDNCSTDDSPRVIEELQREIGSKVRVFEYPHQVTRVGEEYNSVYATDPHSPRLLHIYYNWCLAKCNGAFVTKWDGDMIALDSFVAALERFKKSRYVQFNFGGYNLSSDWRNVLTLDAVIEPRIFPRMFSRFTNGPYSCEQLDDWVRADDIMVEKEHLYAHLKYCKQAPASNISPLFNSAFESRLSLGGATPDHVTAAVNRWLKA